MARKKSSRTQWSPKLLACTLLLAILLAFAVWQIQVIMHLGTWEHQPALEEILSSESHKRRASEERVNAKWEVSASHSSTLATSTMNPLVQHLAGLAEGASQGGSLDNDAPPLDTVPSASINTAHRQIANKTSNGSVKTLQDSTCQVTDAAEIAELLPSKVSNELKTCLGLSTLIYVRTGGQGIHERIPRIEATWAAHLPAGMKVIAFYEGVSKGVTKSGTNMVGTKACEKYIQSPPDLQCCKTAMMLFDARQRLRDGETFSWAFFVDDDVYLWTSHLQIKLCKDHRGDHAPAVALGQPGCGKDGCGGFCGGGGIGFSKAGLEALVGDSDSTSFVKRFLKMCHRCGGWDDVSVGMMCMEARVSQQQMHGSAAWRMNAEIYGLTAVDGTLPIIWHYVRGNMYHLHKLRDWIGSTAAVLRFTSKTEESKCLKWAHEKQRAVRKSPRAALGDVLGLRAGKYATSVMKLGAQCYSETFRFRKVSSVSACMSAVLWSYQCVESTILAFSAGTNECACCDKHTKKSDNQEWSMYKIEAWTTLQAYREVSRLKEWTIGTHISTVEGGGFMDMISEDDGSGRQRFVFEKSAEDWYHIRIYGGTVAEAKYLATSYDGSSVRLASADKGTGRERWTLVKHGQFYHVQTMGKTRSNGIFLSTHSCGCKMELAGKDDGSGRQRWIFDLPPPPPGDMDPPVSFERSLTTAAPVNCGDCCLVGQESVTDCTLGTSFGCYPNNKSMWIAQGCRGVFSCFGKKETECNIKGGGFHVCSCVNQEKSSAAYIA